MKELTKRILTSLFLLGLFALTFLNKYILIFSLILLTIVTWIEFNKLTSKIFIKNNLLKLLTQTSSLLYICLFSLLISEGISQSEPSYKLNMIYLFSICIISDIGGFILAKLLKEKN